MKVGIVLPAFIVFIAGKVFIISRYRLIHIHQCVVQQIWQKPESNQTQYNTTNNTPTQAKTHYNAIYIKQGTPSIYSQHKPPTA